MSLKIMPSQDISYPVNNWRPASLPRKTKMEGKHCLLIPLNINLHGEKLFKLFQGDDQGWTYLAYGPFANYQDFHQWLRSFKQMDDPLFYTIVNSDNNEPIGMCSYLRMEPQHGVIEVGHLHFSHLLQRTIAATEAMYLMMANAFDELGYRRYEWKCDACNQASRQAAARLGFQFEGIFRQHQVYKNRNRDTAWFSVLDSEWPLLKKRFIKWLSPNNFDRNGKQLKRLADI